MLIGARASPLSRAQVEEIRSEFGLNCEVVWVTTTGDLDQTTSLRNLGKTDFFTRELDEMLLQGRIDAAVHSAKDLPDPLPQGLKIAALSKGLDPRDSLVIKKEPIELVATSSVRREEAVRQLFPHCQFVDLRGPIHERLAQNVDGVVVAEAALIRLGLGHLLRIFLPGETAPLQGKLAIVVRQDANFVFRSQA
ncbi:MAG: hydroxymethylbilane synthase [Verrucomicrobia bacterium]|nr:hydroxymethylbilane synthase [Verrucomicrobiota bacterium]MBU6445838.1 hydroxymethylbilane synthase [Verrucomicrobiota bacterium]MDE3047707.1 hydroxymethylbilane synthase [Verrucomicrobiota bacterium]